MSVIVDYRHGNVCCKVLLSKDLLCWYWNIIGRLRRSIMSMRNLNFRFDDLTFLKLATPWLINTNLWFLGTTLCLKTMYNAHFEYMQILILTSAWVKLPKIKNTENWPGFEAPRKILHFNVKIDSFWPLLEAKLH